MSGSSYFDWTQAMLKRANDSQSAQPPAAFLDVVEPEPLPSDHPLWSMLKVTISPHAAGQMKGLKARQVELYRDNIERFMTGKPMRNLVDKKARLSRDTMAPSRTRS